MARKPRPADADLRPATSRITLPRRGGSPVRMDAALMDDVRQTASLGGGDMHLRLWQGSGRLAVEVVVTGPLGAVLDAATAHGLDGIADWLEALDPWADAAAVVQEETGTAGALWAEAVKGQWRSDFRWLVGEALFRWQGMNAGAAAGLETAS